MIKRIAILVLLSMLVWQTVPPPKPLQAAIAQTATGTQPHQGANPVTMAFDCNGGNLLVVGVLTGGDVPRAGGVITYNGVNMTDSGEGVVDSGGETLVEMWYLVNPAGGSNDISIPNTGTTALVPIASAWSGVDAADPLDVSDSDFNVSSVNPSVNITTSAADKLIIDTMAAGRTSIPTGNSHTLIFSIDNGAWTSNAQYTLDDGSAGITLSWTVNLDDWAMIVCAFNPEGAEPVARRIFIID